MTLRRDTAQGIGVLRESVAGRFDPTTRVLGTLSAPFDIRDDNLQQEGDDRALRLSPTGVRYGMTGGVSGPVCALFTLETSGAVDVSPRPDPPECWRNFHWATTSAGSDPGGDPRLGLDPTSAPDDPNAPVTPTDVSEVTPVDPQPAPGADEPTAPRPPAADAAFTIPADRTTVIRLGSTDGGATPIEIVTPPPADRATLSTDDNADGVARTGLDGAVAVTPTSGFTGTLTFGYRAVGRTSDPVATATITVVGPRPPRAVDDAITVPANTESVIEAAVLLANDDPGDEANLPATVEGLDAGLSVVSVRASTDGRAWLDLDGRVRISPTQAGVSSFTYVAASTNGSTTVATVRVTATSATPPGPTDPPPTDPQPPVPTVTVPTVTIPVAPGAPFATPTPAAPPAATPATTPTFDPSGTLPATGSSAGRLLSLAFGLVIAGVLLTAVRRWRWSR